MITVGGDDYTTFAPCSLNLYQKLLCSLIWVNEKTSSYTFIKEGHTDNFNIYMQLLCEVSGIWIENCWSWIYKLCTHFRQLRHHYTISRMNLFLPTQTLIWKHCMTLLFCSIMLNKSVFRDFGSYYWCITLDHIPVWPYIHFNGILLTVCNYSVKFKVDHISKYT